MADLDKYSSILAALNLIEDSVMILDRKWCYLFANETMLKAAGKQKRELIGRNCWEVFPELGGTYVEEKLREAMRTQNRVIFEYQNEAKGRWFQGMAIPSPATLIIHVKEITGAKRATDLNERLTQTLDSLEDPVVMINRNWQYIYTNKAACTFMELERTEILGRVVQELHPEFRGTNFEADCRRAMDGQGPFNWEDYYPPRGCWYKVHVFPSREGIVIHQAETTGVRHQEEAIAKSLLPQLSEEDMRKAFDQMHDPVFIVDKQVRFKYLNQPMIKVSGRSLEQVLGRTPEEAEPPIGDALLNERLHRAAGTGGDDSFEYHSETVRRWFRVGLFALADQIIAVCVDITTLKEREKTIEILTSSLDAALDRGWDRKTSRHNGQPRKREV